MSSQPGTLPYEPFERPPIEPALMAETRPMYWSVRRELWENRWLYLAPLLVAAIVLFASAAHTLTLPKKMRTAAAGGTAQQAAFVTPYKMAPAPIMLATLLVGFFYCFDALHGERRDRSILLWKSLPVSDRTTVLSKAAIPLVVLPLLAYALSVIVQVVLLQLNTLVLLGGGMSPAPLWGEVRFFQNLLIMAYGLTVHALWYAPVYGWLLLVSAWSRRVPLVWAVLPLLAVAAAERILFNSTRLLAMLAYRITGAMKEAFAFAPKGGGNINPLSELDPVRFLSAPGLWVGLLFAALCLAAAVRLRRKREPI